MLGLGGLVEDELAVEVHLAVADGGEADTDRARLAGVNRVASSTLADRPFGASPPNQTSALERRSSANSSVPSASRNRTRRPEPPVTGLIICANGRPATPSWTTARASR